jgi:hypothetical protein
MAKPPSGEEAEKERMEVCNKGETETSPSLVPEVIAPPSQGGAPSTSSPNREEAMEIEGAVEDGIMA